MSKANPFVFSMREGNAAATAAKWEEVTGQIIYLPTGGRDGGPAIQIGETGGDGWMRKQLVPKIVPSAFDEFVVGAAFRPDAESATGPPRIFSLYEGTTQHINLAFSLLQPFDLIVYRGTTVLATIDTNLTLGSWYHVQLAGKIHDTTGYYYVYVNDSLVGSATSQDTRNAGTTGLADRLALGYVNAVTGTPLFTIQDGYFYTVASGPEHPGDLKTARNVVNAAGNSAQFTPLSSTNVSNVDETNTDDDTTYVESSTVGHKDTYAYADIPTNATVLAVQQEVRARKTEAGARTLRTLSRSGGTDFEGPDVTLLDTYQTVIEARVTDPATSAAWAASAVNANEVGQKVQA